MMGNTCKGVSHFKCKRMRKIIAIIFSILLYPHFFTCFCCAQNQLTTLSNMIRSEDSLAIDELDYIFAGEVTDNALWDFSGLETQGRYNIKFDTLDGEHIVGFDRENIWKFKQSDRGLYLTGQESALYSIEYDKPQLLLPLPFNLHQTESHEFYGNGRYCGTHYERLFGNIQVTADALGTLVLSEKDTLKNVLRLYIICTSSIRLNKDSCNNDLDNLKEVITERYLWYVRGYRYPVFETVSSSTFYDMEHVATSQYARRYNPEIQQMLCDSINEIIRSDRPTIPLERHADDIEENHKERGQEGKDGFVYNIGVNENQLIINYSLEKSANLHAMVVDVMGVIHRDFRQSNQKGSGYSLNINCTGLRPSQYIIYINVNGNIYSEKISLK